MAAKGPRELRMKKEMEMLTKSPPHGISCWVKNDSWDRLEAGIVIAAWFVVGNLLFFLFFFA